MFVFPPQWDFPAPLGKAASKRGRRSGGGESLSKGIWSKNPETFSVRNATNIWRSHYRNIKHTHTHTHTECVVVIYFENNNKKKSKFLRKFSSPSASTQQSGDLLFLLSPTGIKVLPTHFPNSPVTSCMVTSSAFIHLCLLVFLLPELTEPTILLVSKQTSNTLKVWTEILEINVSSECWASKFTNGLNPQSQNFRAAIWSDTSVRVRVCALGIGI